MCKQDSLCTQNLSVCDIDQFFGSRLQVDQHSAQVPYILMTQASTSPLLAHRCTSADARHMHSYAHCARKASVYTVHAHVCAAHILNTPTICLCLVCFKPRTLLSIPSAFLPNRECPQPLIVATAPFSAPSHPHRWASFLRWWGLSISLCLHLSVHLTSLLIDHVSVPLTCAGGPAACAGCV